MDPGNLKKIMSKKILFIVGIILISGFSGIIADRFFFPYLATSSFFSKYEFFKKAAEEVTIINKTEQVFIKEESSINKLANQTVPAVVNIISYSEKKSEHINGTGEIITSDGLIMTYASAIIPNYAPNQSFSNNQTGRVFKVITNGGNVYDAELLGIDSWSNLAFLKINANNLPIISLGNSDEHNPGEKVIAVGNNNSGYQNKLAVGLISSFDPVYSVSGEALSKVEKMEGVFLTDFNKEALSPGGLIMDYSGQMIGVIGSAMKNGSEEYFQIPSNKIKMVLDKVMNKNFESNVSLGAYYLPITKVLSIAKGLTLDHGALIYSPSGQQGLAVMANSNADKAGLKINDIITKVGDQEVNLEHNLSDILYKYKKGDKAEFSVLRAGKEMKIEVNL